jgi:hypothetical protein
MKIMVQDCVQAELVVRLPSGECRKPSLWELMDACRQQGCLVLAFDLAERPEAYLPDWMQRAARQRQDELREQRR